MIPRLAVSARSRDGKRKSAGSLLPIFTPFASFFLSLFPRDPRLSRSIGEGCSDDHVVDSVRRGERSSTEVRGRLKPPLPFRSARTFTLRAFERILSRLPYRQMLPRSFSGSEEPRIHHRENPRLASLSSCQPRIQSAWLYSWVELPRTIRVFRLLYEQPSSCANIVVRRKKKHFSFAEED